MRTTHRCVIVDDDPHFLSFARTVISELSPRLELIAFESALEALDFLSGNRVALIVTDFRMPFVNGFQLTAAVRAVDPKVPIVVMSAEQLGLEAIGRGATAFASKPDLRTELRLVFERLGLGSRKRKRMATAPVELELVT